MYFQTISIAILLLFHSVNAQMEVIGQMAAGAAGQVTTDIITNMPQAVEAGGQVLQNIKAADIPSRIENRLRSLRQRIDQFFNQLGPQNRTVANNRTDVLNRYATNAYSLRVSSTVAPISTKAACTTSIQVLPVMTVTRPTSTPCTTSTKKPIIPTVEPIAVTTSCTTTKVTTSKTCQSSEPTVMPTVMPTLIPTAVPTGYPTIPSSGSDTLLPALLSTKTIGAIPSVTATIDPKTVGVSGDVTLVPLSLGTIVTWVLLLI